MSRYKVGDKVVIRKELQIENDPIDYLIIKRVLPYNTYLTEGDHVISGNCFEGLYEEYNQTKPKYNIGDKVVIRKDLVVGEWYSSLKWWNGKEYLKEKDYVVIKEVYYDGYYCVEDSRWISEEMISHKYCEKNNEPPIAVEIRGGYCNQLLMTIPSKTNDLHNNLDVQQEILNRDFHEEIQSESLEVAEGVTVYMRDDLKKNEYYGGLMFDKIIYKQLDKYKTYKVNVMYSNMCMLDNEYNTVVTKEMLITRKPSYIDRNYDEYIKTRNKQCEMKKDDSNYNNSSPLEYALFVIILIVITLVFFGMFKLLFYMNETI